MEHPAWSSLVSLGVGAGEACWGVPAADQPPCADHVCKKGMVQGRLGVEGLFTSMHPACGYVAASSCIVIRCGDAVEKPARPRLVVLVKPMCLKGVWGLVRHAGVYLLLSSARVLTMDVKKVWCRVG